MPSQEETPIIGHRRLSVELHQLAQSLDGQDITLGELVDRIGERGFALLLMILALPAALPLPAPGYATPFGLMMIGLGVQMVLGRQHPKLPQVFRRRVIHYRFLEKTLRAAQGMLRLLEKVIRPRLNRLSRHRSMHAMIGVVVVIMACFMALPVPLTNTAPSFVIFVLACGMLEEDGLVLLGGLILTPLAGGVALLALYFAWTYGLEALEGGLRPLLHRLFG